MNRQFSTSMITAAAVTGHFQAENVLIAADCTAEIDPIVNNLMTYASVMALLAMLMELANCDRACPSNQNYRKLLGSARESKA